MVDITRKDWESAQRQFSNMLVNNLVMSDINNAAVEFIEKKLKEYPEEEQDPKPDTIPKDA